MPLETMLRVVLAFRRIWYAAERTRWRRSALRIFESMRRFAGIELGDDPHSRLDVPSSNFSPFLERHGLTEAIFAT